jgi:hypothetical protein
MSWRRRLRALVVPARRARVLDPGPAGTALRPDDAPLDLTARPQQGRCGDCWVIAALLAIHEAAPDRIAQLLITHSAEPGAGPGSGPRSSPGAGRRPTEGARDARSAPVGVLLRGGRVRIPVDRAMPVDALGRWVGARQSGGAPGWPGLVEKAAAIHVAGSYGLLARGLGRFGLELLTGGRARTHLLLPRAAQLQRWVDQGHAVLASTHPLSSRITTVRGPLPTNHVLVVVGADPRTGDVRLRNPWLPDEVLTIDRRRFRLGFLSVDVTAASLR